MTLEYQKKADSCHNPSIQVRHSLIFPLILIRFAWGLKHIPRENENNMSILRDLVKKSVV